MRTILALLMLAFLSGGAAAYQPDERLADPALEARARAISQELRCVVCQNQSIDDSDADLARDLRVLVRERIVRGDSDGAVLDFVVARYGEFVLLRPRAGWHTALLWGTPVILLLLTAVVLLRRRRARETSDGALSADEERRLAELLER